ncbi:Cytochrome c5 [Thiothrix caldifontis]|uniref:Cytochrome c5 n=1 Tax=Thiothrix caldifontis TaxID=525918 RepID=A0A1H4CSD3_9GAMM|nr:c-type cytochrome [Thiothrix caldifontis]SEA63022.1 Cytochrome c5 [Thiothrix caldifontis]
MKKITISISALFLALGVLSGCGEKKEEAPKAEAPAAEQKPVEQAAQTAPVAEPAPAPAAEPAASNNPMTAMTDAAKAAGDAVSQAADATTQAVGDAAKAAGDAATQAADATTQAVGDAAKAAGDAATQATDATAKAATDAVAAAGAVDGEKVYKGLCFSCHDMGVAGSPKLGDKAAWGPRIATGMDALYTTSLNGKGAMPAKGGNPALSDAEVKAAVDWMVSKAK